MEGMLWKRGKQRGSRRSWRTPSGSEGPRASGKYPLFLRKIGFKRVEKDLQALQWKKYSFMQDLLEEHKIRETKSGGNVLDQCILETCAAGWSPRGLRGRKESKTGIRWCPSDWVGEGVLGADLAHRMIGLTPGPLIRSFEWGQVEKESVEMAEGPNGLALWWLVVVPAKAWGYSYCFLKYMNFRCSAND